MAYCLLTAARNEAGRVESTLRSVASQSLAPTRWVIVDDRSTDDTLAVVTAFQRRFPAIRVVLNDRDLAGFASKAAALNLALATLREEPLWDFVGFVGVLDADVTIPPRYFETLIGRMGSDPRLGLAGGWVHEPHRGTFRPRSLNQRHSVPGCCQMFRRDVLDRIGEFPPARWGGEDWAMELWVGSLGFAVKSFDDLPVYHHKPTVQGWWSGWRTALRQGRMDASLGCGVLYHLARTARRALEPPPLFSAVGRVAGYFWERLRGNCVLPVEVRRYFRAYQAARLKQALALAPRQR